MSKSERDKLIQHWIAGLNTHIWRWEGSYWWQSTIVNIFTYEQNSHMPHHMCKNFILSFMSGHMSCCWLKVVQKNSSGLAWLENKTSLVTTCERVPVYACDKLWYGTRLMTIWKRDYQSDDEGLVPKNSLLAEVVDHWGVLCHYGYSLTIYYI